MKRSIYIFLALATVGLTACTDDEPKTASGIAADVTAEIGEVSSRVASASTKWSAGDKIGISGTSGSVTYSNVPYMTDGNGSFEAAEGVGKGIFFQDNNQSTFTAYYPYSEDVTADNTIIKANTSSQVSTSPFNFLFSSGATGSKNSPALNFTGGAAFKHSMAQLIIHITPSSEDGFDAERVISDSEVTLKGIIQEGEFNPANGQAKATGEPKEMELPLGQVILTLPTGSYNLMFFPQEATDAEVSLTYEGITYACTFSPKLEAGKSYTANFNLKKSGLTLEAVSIADWVVAGNPIEGDAAFTYPSEVNLNGHDADAVLMRKASSKYPPLYVAKCNLGASKPEDKGLYYWWGATEGHPVGYDFVSQNPPSYGMNVNELYANGYITSTNSITTVLTDKHDAAKQALGGNWHMPDYADLQWLIMNCVWTWNNSKNGFDVKSLETSNTIFLPNAGRISAVGNETTLCDYMSSTPLGEYHTHVLMIRATEKQFALINFPRNTGQSIRPVASVRYSY